VCSDRTVFTRSFVNIGRQVPKSLHFFFLFFIRSESTRRSNNNVIPSSLEKPSAEQTAPVQQTVMTLDVTERSVWTLVRLNLTYLLTPWCRILLEKLTGLPLVRKFPAFHGTRRFITALTSVRHLSLSWASPIQSIYPPPADPS
jgi:hypothetical protein